MVFETTGSSSAVTWGMRAFRARTLKRAAWTVRFSARARRMKTSTGCGPVSPGGDGTGSIATAIGGAGWATPAGW